MEFNDVRLQAESLRQELRDSFEQTLESGHFILGPAVAAFEEEFARYCGVRFGVGVATGTDALMLGLQALGVRAGDDVLVPAVSATATAMAVVNIGARPVFVDLDENSFTMCADSAASRLTPRTTAIVPVHLYGAPAALEALDGLGLPILEDAAQAHGSDAPWGRAGSFGRAAAFSFYPTKNLGTYGDGGMVVTSDAEVADRLRLLRNYGQRRNYHSETTGWNSRLDELHARILSTKLPRLDAWNEARRHAARIYVEGLAGLPVRLQQSGRSNQHLFVVATPHRDALREHLTRAGVPTLVHYPLPLHQQPAFRHLEPHDCPVAARLCAEVLSLPMHAFLDDRDALIVVEAIRQFFGRTA